MILFSLYAFISLKIDQSLDIMMNYYEYGP